MARAIRAPGPGAREAVLVWDLPLRLFHWTLVLLFLAAWWTGSREKLFALHEACGLALSGLLVFRVVWGFAGNRAARFASFPAVHARSGRISGTYSAGGCTRSRDTTRSAAGRWRSCSACC